MASKSKKRGRPVVWTPERRLEAWQEIERRLVEGEGIDKICGDKHLPAYSTVFAWLGEDADLDHRYIRARESQQHLLAAKGQTLANQTLERAQNGEASKEEISAVREVLQQLRWQAARLAPKTFGDTLKHTGHDGGPVQVAHTLENAILQAREHAERLKAPTIDGEAEEMTQAET